MFLEKLGNNLKTLRDREGLSQQVVADKISVSRSAIAKFETGLQEPDVETLCKLAALYHTTVDKLCSVNSDRYIIVDTSLLMSRPNFFKSMIIHQPFSKIYVLDIVIGELNALKDKANRTANLVMADLANLLKQHNSTIVRDKCSCLQGNNDDKILGHCISIAENNKSSTIYLLTTDKDFTLKDPNISNLKIGSLLEFPELLDDRDFNDFDKQMNKELFDGVKNKDMTKVYKILRSPWVDVNYYDPNTGYTPLIQAVVNKDHQMIAMLVKSPRLKVNAVDSAKYFLPALSWAVQKQSLSIVKMLIKAGADVNAPSESVANPFNTPLMIAAWHGNLSIVKYLIDHGACIDQQDRGNGFTPLFKAVFQNHPEVVQYLVDAGANIHIRTWENMTPLNYACKNNSKNKYNKIISILRNASSVTHH